MMRVTAPSGPLAEALAAAGHEVVPGAVGAEPVAAWCADEETAPEEIRRIVDFVLRGGRLLLCGGAGPLPAALHLTVDKAAVEGVAEPVAAGVEPIGPVLARPVTGVGYSLARVEAHCVALGGPRGDGFVAHLGDENPAPALAAACLAWISRQDPPLPRSI